MAAPTIQESMALFAEQSQLALDIMELANSIWSNIDPANQYTLVGLTISEVLYEWMLYYNTMLEMAGTPITFAEGFSLTHLLRMNTFLVINNNDIIVLTELMLSGIEYLTEFRFFIEYTQLNGTIYNMMHNLMLNPNPVQAQMLIESARGG